MYMIHTYLLRIAYWNASIAMTKNLAICAIMIGLSYRITYLANSLNNKLLYLKVTATK